MKPLYTPIVQYCAPSLWAFIPPLLRRPLDK